MMKKNFLLALFCSTVVYASYIEAAPTGYTSLLNNKHGIKGYESKDGKILVIDAPLGSFKLDFSSTGKPSGKNKWGGNLYKRKYLTQHYADILEKDNSENLYAVLNSQFFGKYPNNTATFAFPLKGNGTIYQEDDTEKKYGKRTLYMYKGIFPIFTDGYNKKLLKNSKITDVISALNPSNTNNLKDKLKPKSKIGRHYIGCIPLREYSKKLSTCKNIVFFYSTLSTNKEMISAMTNWGIKKHHIMAMDGSGSAQIYSEVMTHSGIIEGYGAARFNIPDYRDLPGVISIYRR